MVILAVNILSSSEKKQPSYLDDTIAKYEHSQVFLNKTYFFKYQVLCNFILREDAFHWKQRARLASSLAPLFMDICFQEVMCGYQSFTQPVEDLFPKNRIQITLISCKSSSDK